MKFQRTRSYFRRFLRRHRRGALNAVLFLGVNGRAQGRCLQGRG